MKTLAEELLEQLMLFTHFKYLDDNALKQVMNNPDSANQLNKINSNNLAA
ncbi:MAG: hypothetical protein HC917_02150 [Richelia sp. SM2_1_7]|nr:hypothetical protein [Richelia sp. SM2_1_7]